MTDECNDRKLTRDEIKSKVGLEELRFGDKLVTIIKGLQEEKESIIKVSTDSDTLCFFSGKPQGSADQVAAEFTKEIENTLMYLRSEIHEFLEKGELHKAVMKYDEGLKFFMGKLYSPANPAMEKAMQKMDKADEKKLTKQQKEK